MRFLWKKPQDKALREALILAATCLVVGIAVVSMQPSFSSGRYTVQGSDEEQSFTLPLRFRSEPQIMDMKIPIRMPRIGASHFRFSVDDCIESMSINGNTIEHESLPYCNHSRPLTLDLSSHLRSGLNILSLQVKNHGGPGRLSIGVSPLDPLVFGLWVVIAVLAVLLTERLSTYWKFSPRDHWISIIVAIGILLRLVYMLSTPADVRGHDTEGHLEYMNHVIAEKRLPEFGEAWEWYQPPLYYLLGIPIIVIERHLEITEATTLFHLQWIALLLSIGVLIVTAWAARMLTDPKDNYSGPLILAVFASFPSLIFFAARINNDVLLHFFAFLSLTLLIAWWKNGKQMYWYSAITALALGLLSKGNALLLLPILFGCLLLKPKLPLQKKIVMGTLSVLILSVLTGWYFGLRHFSHNQEALVGNIATLHSGLKVKNTVAHLTVFDPFQIMEHPFNDAWKDDARRQYFWEYWYKSALFGEFHYPDTIHTTAYGLLGVSFGVLLLVLLGMWHTVRRTFFTHLPLLATTGIIALGHLVFRIRYPYSPSQDFRYSVLILLPIGFFVSESIKHYPKLRWLSVPIVIAFCVLVMLFILGMSVQ